MYRIGAEEIHGGNLYRRDSVSRAVEVSHGIFATKGDGTKRRARVEAGGELRDTRRRAINKDFTLLWDL